MPRIRYAQPIDSATGRIGVFTLYQAGDPSARYQSRVLERAAEIRSLKEQIAVIDRQLPTGIPHIDDDLNAQRVPLVQRLDALEAKPPPAPIVSGRAWRNRHSEKLMQKRNAGKAAGLLREANRILDGFAGRPPTPQELAQLNAAIDKARKLMALNIPPADMGNLVDIEARMKAHVDAAQELHDILVDELFQKAVAAMERGRAEALEPLPAEDAKPTIPGLNDPPQPAADTDKPLPEPKPPSNRCDCKAWRFIDELWARGHIDKGPWNAAIKAPRKSGYDIWMREAVSLTARGHYLPDTPSPSGGYSARKATPGFVWQPPGQCIRQYAKICWIETWFPGGPWSLHYLWLQWHDPRTPPLDVAPPLVKWYADGWDFPPRQEAYPHPGTHQVMFSGFNPVLFWFEVVAQATDGTFCVTRFDHTQALSNQGYSVPTATHARRGWWH